MLGLFVFLVTQQACVLIKTFPCCATVAALQTNFTENFQAGQWPHILNGRAL